MMYRGPLRGSRFVAGLLLMVACLINQGCGIKLVYNNADRLARWWVSDYIDLDKPQRRYFDASAAQIMFWHRTTQLSVYREMLLDLADEIDRGAIDKTRLDSIVAEVEAWAMAFNARSAPVARDILLALSPAQQRKFEKALQKSNRDYERESRKTPSERAQEEAKDYAWLVKKFVGRLSADQKALILEKHLEMFPDAQVILDYRIEWQQKLLQALRSEPPDEGLIFDLMVNFDAHYPPDFERMVEVNEVVYENLTLELIASLSETQRVRMASELRNYARIFMELIEEAPELPPPVVTPLPRYKPFPQT